MRQLILLLVLTIKEHIKKPVFLAFLICMPLAAALFFYLPDNFSTAEISIGIYAAKADNLTEEIMNELLQKDGMIHFISYEYVEAMQSDIMTGKISCGYCFPENLSGKLADEEFKAAITVLCASNSDITVSLANEMIFSVLLKHYGYDMMYNYAVGNSLLQGEEALFAPMLKELYASYSAGDSTFHVEFDTVSSDDSFLTLEEIEVSNSLFPLRGILAILIFTAGLFGSLKYLRNRSAGTFVTMPSMCRIAAAYFYPFTLCLLTAISAIPTLYISGFSYGLAHDCIQMFFYICMITIFCVILSHILCRETLFAAAIPVCSIICLIVCPVFVNIAPLIPQIKVLRWFLPPMYFLG
jgi:ABC-2 type transport system permease protein